MYATQLSHVALYNTEREEGELKGPIFVSTVLIILVFTISHKYPANQQITCVYHKNWVSGAWRNIMLLSINNKVRLPCAGTDVCEASLYRYICQSTQMRSTQNYADTVLTDAYLKVHQQYWFKVKYFCTFTEDLRDKMNLYIQTPMPVLK